MKYLQKLTIWLTSSLASMGLVLAVVSTPVISAATPQETACETLKNLGEECNDAAENKVIDVIEKVIDILSLVVGIGSVLMITISGFRFVVSGGEANTVKSARSGIVYALIGIVVVVLAQAIVAFVLHNL